MQQVRWFQCRYVRCGNPRCRSCPHGPYWYGHYREGGRMKSKYFGRMDPRPDPQPVDPWEAIFSKAGATEPLARSILGVSDEDGKVECLRQFRRLMLLNHPDRGGDPRRAAMVNAAYSWLAARFGW